MLTVYGPHWVCPSSRWHVLPRSTLLRLQGALRGTVQSRPCPSCTSEVQAAQVLRSSARAQIWLGMRFVPFPAPRSLGDQVLCECTVLAGPSALLTSPRAARFPWCTVCLLWGPELRLQPSWQMSAIQDPRKTCLASGSLFTVLWRMLASGPRLQQPLAFWFWLSHACLSASNGGGKQNRERPVSSWLGLFWRLVNHLLC